MNGLSAKFVEMVTIQNAVSRFIDGGTCMDLVRAVEKTPARILNETCDGIRWENGEDTIDSDAFRYGLEIAENCDAMKIDNILKILGG